MINLQSKSLPMFFQLFNLDQKNEKEVYLYGKEYEKNGKIVTLVVKNVISPVYLLPTPMKEELLIRDLKNFTKEIKDITMVNRTNIFNNAVNKNLNVYKVTLNKFVSFSNFESEYCEMLQTEFQNPVENLVISKAIMGPGVLQIENIINDTVEYSDISFVKNSKFPKLKIAAITFDSRNGNIDKFVYYSEYNKTFFRAIVSKIAVPNYKQFSSSRDLNVYLNEIIRLHTPDVIVVHNFHLKSKLSIRDKIYCDLYHFACGTIKGRDYSIQEISSLYKINKGPGLDGDAVALISIFNAMNALNLAKEMAEISGYILNKCLINSRAERIEYTLLHDLYSRDYMFPSDKPKQNTKYAGGLVLDPVQGFYEDVVLLFDFNSLYPSIIQEFNVCFSTIGSSGFYLTSENTAQILKDPGVLSSMVDQNEECFLPKILRNLVKRRRAVKELIKGCKSNEEKLALNGRQMALKLTANSIYGCLGFSGSRFCNFEMAAFITAKGREILNETKLIAESLNMRVIYGDTDSIMIHTKFPGSLMYYDQAIESGKALVKMINSKYDKIEIEMEKAFKKLLLFTKKKYASLVFDKSQSYIETKGIDLVRRDFCRASSDLSHLVLNIILEDKEKKGDFKVCLNNNAETVGKIYNACTQYYSTLFNRPADDFIITSALSKDISLYASGSNLPHVNLALRLKAEQGIIYKQDDVISYVIGEGEGNVSTRSFHPEEAFNVDYQFYIKNQILPSLFRLTSLVSNIHCEKINYIFNVKDYTTKAIQKNLSFIMPCCEHVQECAKYCVNCKSPVPNYFYLEKINGFLLDGIQKLYKDKAACLDCGHEYSNHLSKCFYCNKDLTSNFKNQEFNTLLDSIESSFKNLKIPEIESLISCYSEISNYRVINLKRYFPIEVENYKRTKRA